MQSAVDLPIEYICFDSAISRTNGFILGLTGDANYTYGKIGNFSFTVTVRNRVSMTTATVYLPVQIEITGFALISSQPIRYGHPDKKL